MELAADEGGTGLTATLADAPTRVALDASSHRSAEAPGRLPVGVGARLALPPTVRGLAAPDDWRHLGDAIEPRSVVRRIDLIDLVRRDGPRTDAPEVARMRAIIDRPMVMADAIDASGDGDVGFRAIVRLIADGCVRMRDGWSIAREKTVEPCGHRPGPATP